MYKGLGFDPLVDKDGRLTKMLIRESLVFLVRKPLFTNSYLPLSGAESGDVHRVTFDRNMSDAEYTSLLWKLAIS